MAKIKKYWYETKREELAKIDDKNYTWWHLFLDQFCVLVAVIHAAYSIGLVIWMISWRVLAIFLLPILWVMYQCYKDNGKRGQSL